MFITLNFNPLMCCLLFHKELDSHAIKWLNNGHSCDMGCITARAVYTRDVKSHIILVTII